MDQPGPRMPDSEAINSKTAVLADFEAHMRDPAVQARAFAGAAADIVARLDGMRSPIDNHGRPLLGARPQETTASGRLPTSLDPATRAAFSLRRLQLRGRQ